MRKPLKIRPFACTAVLFALAWACGAAPAAIADPAVAPAIATPATPTDSAMTKLGRDFLSKIGGNIGEADLYLTGAGKLQLAEHRAGTTLPDNEPLLLHPVIGNDIISGSQDVLSIKRDHRLLLSLGDFASATGLAITVKPASGTAFGWFVRQSQTFSLDAKKAEVTISGRTSPVPPADVQVEGNDLLVSADLLEKWFSLSFDYDFSGLNLIIKTYPNQKLPVELAYDRSQKQSVPTYGGGPATLPYMATPYALLSQPYIDADLDTLSSRAPGVKTQTSANLSTIMSGDIAGMNAQAYLSGSQEKPYLNTARVTLGKQDVNGQLLGPLHATSYQLGDVNTVPLPLVGSGAQEEGVTISDEQLNSSTTRTSVPIHGNAQSGWDVELYRNSSYIDIRHVDATGLYDFGNVDLIVGDNDFKFLFYGPQGEVHETHRHVGVNAQAASMKGGHYSVSATRENTTTFDNSNTNQEGKGAPHLAGSYEYGIPGFGTGNVGLRTSNDAGSYRAFAESGLATYAYSTFFNADLGVDTGTGAASGILTARHNFNTQAGLLQYAWNAPDFNVSSPEVGAGTKQTLRGSLSGPLGPKFLFIDRPNYNVEGQYYETYQDSNQFGGSATVSGLVERIALSASGQYNQNTTVTKASGNLANIFGITPATNTPAVDTTNTIRTSSISMNARGFVYGGTYRIGGQYELMPTKRLEELDAEYDHSLGENLDTTATLTYTPDPELETAALSLNWRTSKAIISPTIQVNSQHNLLVGANVHFAVGADPYSHSYKAYSTYLTGQGGVAARIFLDKDGDGIYDDGDELLTGATLKAAQAERTVASNDKGIAFIPDLPQNQLTDISVDAATSQDAYGLSMFKGVSIRPHPGSVTQLEFPIVEGGEMDGQADFAGVTGTRRPASGVKISLIDPTGKEEQTANAANDGYWSLSTIRPGIYYLTAEVDPSSPGYMTPRLVEFKPDGTTLFGQPVLLAEGHNIGFHFTAENDAPDGPQHTRVIRALDIASQYTKIELGPFHSRLAMNVAWLKLKIQAHAISGLFDPAMPIGKIEADAKTGDFTLALKPKSTMGLQEAANACAAMSDAAGCAVDIITKYKPYTPPTKKMKSRSDDMILAAYAAEQGAGKPVKGPKKVAVMHDVDDYVAYNPTVDKKALSDKTVIVNLGSYNSRVLMAVMWLKLRMKDAALLGNAHLLVQPSDSYPSPKTGKYVLRAVLDTNVEDAANKCDAFMKRNQYCQVEILPKGEQLSAAAVGTLANN